MHSTVHCTQLQSSRLLYKEVPGPLQLGTLFTLFIYLSIFFCLLLYARSSLHVSNQATNTLNKYYTTRTTQYRHSASLDFGPQWSRLVDSSVSKSKVRTLDESQDPILGAVSQDRFKSKRSSDSWPVPLWPDLCGQLIPCAIGLNA